MNTEAIKQHEAENSMFESKSLANIENIEIKAIRSIDQLHALEHAWGELHEASEFTSVYNSFDFVLSYYEHALEKDESILLFQLEQNNKLLAIFPWQYCVYSSYLFRLRTIENTALPETDKPSPIIANGMRQHSWFRLGTFLQKEFKSWDLLHLNEIPEHHPDHLIFQELSTQHGFIYRQNPDKHGPVIDLSGGWEDFWNAHPKMRKKVRKMEKDFAERMEFVLIEDEWEKALDWYVQLEQTTWKAGKVGVGKHAKSRKFYEALMNRLQKKHKLFFGILLIDGIPASAEIAYTHQDKVYFCHGCFSDKYKKYSPGMVSTSLFLKYFFEREFKHGDFLCGYAGYLNAWSENLETTKRIDLYRPSIQVRWMFLLRAINKVSIAPLKSLLGLKKD